ncbi:hypothetical protein F5B19DRAFT_490122 [Rostrohypoxylon terebratum]|nr:hypothetical protein F5B19DRAFT_490122 [Rostrohypoxylon terebratum]
MEYNPNWKIPTQNSIDYPNLSDTIGDNVPIRLIDYTIRPTKDPSHSRTGIREDRDVLYGNGYRLVSVHSSDTEWEFDDGTCLLTERRSASHFANDSQKACKLCDVRKYSFEAETIGTFYLLGGEQEISYQEEKYEK